MKTNKRLCAAWCGLLALCMLTVCAQAAGKIDFSRDTGLTLYCADNGVPLSGVRFDLYLVAQADEYGELTVTPAFSIFNVNIRGENDGAWRALASTLEGYTAGMTPDDSAVSDPAGWVRFPTGTRRLVPGLYFVQGRRHTQDGRVYDFTPFLVLLPENGDEDWLYGVTACPKFTVTEDVPETVTRKVLKIWDDAGRESLRPQTVTVRLLRDGEVYDTVTLSAENGWRYTWTELSGEAWWTVAEDVPAGYVPSVSREGVTFVITNTCRTDVPVSPGTPTNPGNPGTPGRLPQTGQLWWPVPVLTAAGLALVILGLLRRRRKGHAE